MLAQLLTKHGLGVRVEGAGALSTQNMSRLEIDGAALACLCFLDATSPAHMRYAVRRLRRKLPGAKVILGCFSKELDGTAGENLREGSKADVLATTLRGTVQACLDEAQTPVPVVSSVLSAPPLESRAGVAA